MLTPIPVLMLPFILAAYAIMQLAVALLIVILLAIGGIHVAQAVIRRRTGATP